MGDYYQVTEWREGYYRIGSPENVFSEVIIGTDKALLFDTGYGFGNLAKTVKEITDLPLIIVNSHGHVDHCGGNYQFDEPGYLHPADMELSYSHTSEKMRALSVEQAKETRDILTGEKHNILPEKFDEDSYITAGIGDLIPMEEGQIFDLGGKKLEVVGLPGHTPGSVGLLEREDEILFVGDAINAHLWLFLPESLKLSDYIATLHKAQELPFSQMVQAHHPMIAEKDVLTGYLDTAENLDIGKGHPYPNAIFPEIASVICAREGYDFRDPGFSSIVISEEHLG